MNRCILLGAGASLGYLNKNQTKNDREVPPSSKQFFSRGQELRRFDRDLYPDLHAIFSQYISDRGGGKMDPYDIERVMKYALDHYDLEDYNQLTYYIYSLFQYYSNNYSNKKEDNYKKLARHFKENRFNVISLNYDILFEAAANSLGLNISYQNKPLKRTIAVSKPHGSINLFHRIPKPNIISFSDDFATAAGQLERSVIRDIAVKNHPDFEEDLRTGPEYWDNKRVSDTKVEDLIYGDPKYFYKLCLLPPDGKGKIVRKNTTSERPALAYIEQAWKQADKMLQDADELIIIGSQLRENDDQLRNTISQNLSDGSKVTLVVGSGGKDIESRLEGIGEYDVENKHMRFGQYVDEEISK